MVVDQLDGRSEKIPVKIPAATKIKPEILKMVRHLFVKTKTSFNLAYYL
jgi:hypothetical protein